MELETLELEHLSSLVSSYARLTDVTYGSKLKDEKIMPKHEEAREKVLDAIMELFGQGGEEKKRRIIYSYATPEEIADPNIHKYDLEGTKSKAIRRVEVMCWSEGLPAPHLSHATTEELFEEIGTRIGTSRTPLVK